MKIEYYCFCILQEKVGSWYSNPGTGATDSGTVGGGVGRYLKAKTTQVEPTTGDTSIPAVSAKKRKTGLKGDFKDFSGW